MDLWPAVHRARRELADDLADLGVEDWRHPTLCEDWDVEQVVAHLTAGASIGPAAWVRSMVLAGLRPAVHNARRLREHRGGSPQETLARFEAVVSASIAPSKDLPAYLGEVIVHGEDIRHPLGMASAPDAEALTSVAEFFAARNFTVRSRSTAQGLGLIASDGPFRSGEGPQVVGPTLALVMVMAGRASHLEQLRGQGLAELARRCA